MSPEYTIHGAEESYFTGKLEAYFRAKGIEYSSKGFSPADMSYCAERTGVTQVPQVECSDGSWLIDTTLIIEYIESIQPEPRVAPTDGAVNFLSLLLEDYADEWLWRPAMHYRWSYPETARVVGERLAGHLSEVPLPNFAKVWYWRLRQKRTFVTGDGVTPQTWPLVEAFYLETLDSLQSILDSRPFVFGQRPTQADFGFFGPMYRHFFCDPTPARIMRERAPAVLEWVARMWNLSPKRFEAAAMPSEAPADTERLFAAVVTDYLPYLAANETAYAGDRRMVSYAARNVEWSEPTKPYRVWCLDRLRQAFAVLGEEDRSKVGRYLGDAAVGVLTERGRARAPQVLDVLPIPPGGVARKPVDSWWRS